MKKILSKLNLKFYVAIIAFIAIVAAILYFYYFSNKLVCTSKYNLIKGFDNEETVTFYIVNNKVNHINQSKTVKLSDYYDSYGTFYNSLKGTFENGYSYLDKSSFSIKKVDKSIVVNVSTNKGIIFNNLSIKKNTDYNDLSLRFNIYSDLKENKNTILVGDKYTNFKLKEKMKSLNYDCK